MRFGLAEARIVRRRYAATGALAVLLDGPGVRVMLTQRATYWACCPPLAAPKERVVAPSLTLPT
jgi:hypothetical protein